MSSWCPSSPAPTGPAPSRVVSVNQPAQQPPGTQPSPEIPRDCRVSASGVLRTIRGPRLSSLGSCGWSGVTADCTLHWLCSTKVSSNNHHLKVP